MMGASSPWPRGGGRGRPRSSKADRAILEAALRVFRERGFADTTIEAVADEAGVAKTTVYRRYASKVELITAALGSYLRVDELPDTGSLRGDMLAFLGEGMLALFAGQGVPMVGELLAAKDRNPELIETFRQRMIAPRLRQLHSVFERAAGRGEIAADVDEHVAAQALVGVLIARALSGAPIDRRAAEAAVDVVLCGILPRSGRDGRALRRRHEQR